MEVTEKEERIESESSGMETEEKPVISLFTCFQEYLSNDQEIREAIRLATRDLEQTAREVIAVLQAVHQNSSPETVNKLCAKSREMFSVVKSQYVNLIEKIPTGQYYRFCDHWRFVNQRFAFLAALVVYLEREELITRQEVAAMLGVQVERSSSGFFIDLDDFLTGVLLLANELSRLALNSVSAADYGRPFRIAAFVGEMDAGFRLLNLKNDSLRKKFDGLKYDLKKVEEVVYDLTIRGLKPVPQETS